jgi:hypothetical protein
MSRRGEKEKERRSDRWRQALSLTGNVAQIHICPQRHLACVHLLSVSSYALTACSLQPTAYSLQRLRAESSCVRLLCLPLLSGLEDLARS